KRWYGRVISLFFDEQHTVRNIEVHSSTDDQADITLVVRWQSSWWQTPAPQSRRIDLEATQRWTVRSCPTTKNAFGLEIVSYVISNDLKYAPGSATLPETSSDGTEELRILNERIGDMEQQAGDEALDFFKTYASDKLLFHRASGTVVGKSGQGGLLEGLK